MHFLYRFEHCQPFDFWFMINLDEVYLALIMTKQYCTELQKACAVPYTTYLQEKFLVKR